MGNMIHVTEKAAQKIQELLRKEGVPDTSGGLRVGVQGGGCSGLSYAMRLDTQARDRDKVFEENGARVFVDPKSILYLDNTTLDYEETLMRQGFVFQNPKPVAMRARARLSAALLMAAYTSRPTATHSSA